MYLFLGHYIMPDIEQRNGFGKITLCDVTYFTNCNGGPISLCYSFSKHMRPISRKYTMYSMSTLTSMTSQFEDGNECDQTQHLFVRVNDPSERRGCPKSVAVDASVLGLGKLLAHNLHYSPYPSFNPSQSTFFHHCQIRRSIFRQKPSNAPYFNLLLIRQI